MMDSVCPKGHLSTDPDYCSECGAKMQVTPDGLAAPPMATFTNALVSAGGEDCPDCGTPRANASATFCEVCRYDFVKQTSWTTPPVPSVAPPPPAEAAAPLPEPALVAPPDTPVDAPPPTVDRALLPAHWEAVVQVDPTLYGDPDPLTPCPTDEPERTYHLDFAENLIGRRSDSRDIHPEISLRDPGVSHRHAKLLRQPNAGLVLLDVGSTNGTQLNGQDVPEGVKTPLKDGDQIVLGCWTRITLHEVRS